MKLGKRVDFTGYRQRHVRANLKTTFGTQLIR
jgi:hypothetical protein